MDTILQSDIFFFITSVVVVIAGIVLAIVGIYVIIIVGRIKRVVTLLTGEIDLLVSALHSAHGAVKKVLSFKKQTYGDKKNKK